MKGFARRRLRILWVLIWHIMLPLWFVILLATTGTQDSSTWLMVLFAAAMYLAFISMAGSWSWFGIYGQRALPLIIVVAALISRPRFLAVNDSPQAAQLRLLSLALALVFIVMTVFAIGGRRAKKTSLNLAFPLGKGTYIVAQGGATRTINRHSARRTERFAVDIVKLGALGIRAYGLYPIALKKYAIFGAEVLSPCDGTVVALEEDLPDHVPPDRDSAQPAGNYVAIECESAIVYVTHLMKGTITVDVGRRVRTGQVLGRVGNSGNSAEPHLHIHAETPADAPGGSKAIPIRIGGRFLVRNDIVEA